ncbi:MAG TPA: hypothetical protein VH593_20190, partial [Ktedonobacteraceae bacterium]
MTHQQPHDEPTETIVRFSSAWWAYLFFRLGILRALVNGVEDALAITGRFLLLAFLIYCGAEAGLLLSDPNFSFPSWLQMLMFCMQLAGLEGSIPGLARQADTLRAQHDERTAKSVERVMLSARVMTVLSITEGALHALHIPPTDLQVISAILLVVRGMVITGFLIALAKIERKAPRVLSREAHTQEQATQVERDEQTRTITALRTQLDEVRTALQTTKQQALQNEREQERVITHLRAQVQQMKVAQTSLLAGAEGQESTTRRLQEQLQFAERETAQLQRAYQRLSADLQQKDLQIADLTAKLQTTQRKLADLQTTERATASSAKPMTPNITSIDRARAKHEAGKARVSHADVI